MSNKAKNVSISAMDKAISENIQKTVDIEWCGLEIRVTRFIPLETVAAIVENVAKACFSNEDSLYIPYVLWPALRAGIIGAYTNISMPSNPDKTYMFAYADGLYEKIIENVNKTQVNDLISATIERVKTTVESRISSINKEMEDIHEYLENIDSGLSDMLSGVSPDDLKNIITALDNGALNEDKVVKAYLDTYKK